MAEPKLNKPIGNSLLWEDFIKNNPKLPSFSGFGEFLEWSLKNNVPNPYKLWQAKLDFDAAEDVLKNSPSSQDEEKKPEKKKKERKHEEHDTAEEVNEVDDKTKEKKPKQEEKTKTSRPDKPDNKSETDPKPDQKPVFMTEPPAPAPREVEMQRRRSEGAKKAAWTRSFNKLSKETAEGVILASQIDSSPTTSGMSSTLTTSASNEIKPSEYEAPLPNETIDVSTEIDRAPQNSIEQMESIESIDSPTRSAASYSRSPSVPVRLPRSKKPIGATKIARTAVKVGRIPGVGWVLLIALGLLIFGLIALVVVIGFSCFITNNPIGDLLNINACRATTTQTSATPTPTPTIPPVTDVTDGFPFYCQYGAVNNQGVAIRRGSWNYNYGSRGNERYCNIYGSGCAMAALASIQTFFGDTTTPSQASQQNGNVGCQSPGTTNTDAKAIVKKLKSQGYKIPGADTSGIFGDLVQRSYSRDYTSYRGFVNLRQMKEYIDNGYLLWAGAKIKYATRTGLTGFGGHAFVVTDVNLETGAVTGYDPTFCQSIPRLSGGKRVFYNVNNLGGDFGCDGNCGWTMLWPIKK